MKSENLEITVEGSRLRIAGNRPDCCRAPNCSFLVMEINLTGHSRACLNCRPVMIWASAKGDLCEWILYGWTCRLRAPVAGQADQSAKFRLPRGINGA